MIGESASNRSAEKIERLCGLDLARYCALIGMVIVNFSVVMVPRSTDHDPDFGYSSLLQGRAAASFVVLAGIGLGLGSAGKPWKRTLAVTLRRAVFLLVVGLLNMLIFEADIIHYYAFYFFLSLWFLRMPSRLVVGVIGLLVLGFVGLVLALDYDAGWDWATYSYSDFWTARGFFRNLFFNGWHPVVPWLAFLLFGLLLSRLNLNDRIVQTRMLLIGTAVFAFTSLLSLWMISVLESTDPELALLFSTSPVPPFPLYMIAGGSAASVLIALCLRLEPLAKRVGVLKLITPAGRQTLTLYMAHIVIGIGALEAFGWLGNSTPAKANLAAAFFSTMATLFAVLWARYFERGLIEGLMRKVTG